MKARVNLTIEEDLLAKAKIYASKQGRSVSDLVEEFLQSLASPKKGKHPLFELMDQIKPSMIYPDDFNFKEEYYKGKSKRYGF